ncbi:Acyl-CoA N-acyltransferase [Arabidopsis thaliana x Arabidopsis arenosa]|uniref:Acyl-CoA N-acyltransferase n=1 Tax=Arabidopsis thaliana x Arabidopsis arenosa TaxID=1240361 RepID=A0A8T1Y661_9BRAS|nr:Acyl-CoA N-acyltransferase [Arabidopsis thaliana x Arabidopsis arenosa]
MVLAVCVGNSSLVSMELRWARRRKSDNAASALPRSIPIYISTLKKDINLEELRNLYSLCNHSCNRLSEYGSNVGKIVDMKKLRVAISRSDVVVSVFCKPHHGDVDDDAVLYSEEESLSSSLYHSEFGRQNKDESFLGDLFQNAMPLTPSTGQLVGFGRAYSDYGLTASIHDLMVLLFVAPSLTGYLLEFCFHYLVHVSCSYTFCLMLRCVIWSQCLPGFTFTTTDGNR